MLPHAFSTCIYCMPLRLKKYFSKYRNEILLVLLYLNSAQKTSINRIIWLLFFLLCWPKVILLSGGHISNNTIYITVSSKYPSNWNYFVKFNNEKEIHSFFQLLFAIAIYLSDVIRQFTLCWLNLFSAHLSESEFF